MKNLLTPIVLICCLALLGVYKTASHECAEEYVIVVTAEVYNRITADSIVNTSGGRDLTRKGIHFKFQTPGLYNMDTMWTASVYTNQNGDYYEEHACIGSTFHEAAECLLSGVE